MNSNNATICSIFVSCVKNADKVCNSNVRLKRLLQMVVNDLDLGAEEIEHIRQLL